MNDFENLNLGLEAMAQETVKTQAMGNTSMPGKKTNNDNKGNNKAGKPDSSRRGRKIPKTYKIPERLIRQVEAVAYWRRKKKQEIVSLALAQFISTVSANELAPIPSEDEHNDQE